MHNDSPPFLQSPPNSCHYLAVVLAAAVLTGCNVKEDPTGVIAITVSPGETGNCETSPCQISLVMPAGSGSYEVTGNQVSLGTYPAGQTVKIGSFWQSQAIEVKGADVPKAYVYIPNTP
jgi:hypothetical protein